MFATFNNYRASCYINMARKVLGLLEGAEEAFLCRVYFKGTVKDKNKAILGSCPISPAIHCAAYNDK